MKKFPPASERLLRCVGSTSSFSPKGPSSSPKMLQRTTSRTRQHRTAHTINLGQNKGQESGRTWDPEQHPAAQWLPSWGRKKVPDTTGGKGHVCLQGTALTTLYPQPHHPARPHLQQLEEQEPKTLQTMELGPT